jgi:outer membrane assembly lipoprotein YfiO
MKKFGIGILLICGLLLISCAGGAKIKSKQYDCSMKMSDALELYKKQKYSRVKTLLEDVKIQCSGSPVIDSVLYYLGMSDMHMKAYVDARTEFEALAQDFPNSPFYEEAQFRIGLSVYRQSHTSSRDQTETKEAIRLLRDFLETYPDGNMADSASKYLNDAVEKLAQKEFDNARFYEKIHEPEAAVMYYKSFVNEYPGSRLTDQACLNLAELLLKLDRKSEAQEVLDRLLESSKDKDVINKAKALRSSTS